MLTQLLFSQSEKKIFGYVFDKQTNSPLVGANIILDESGGGTSTDEFGFYQFENILSGKYSITVSYVGYKVERKQNITVKKDNSERIDFYLTPKADILDEVIVASKQDEGVKTYLYTNEEIAKSNFKNIGELINNTPGVEIQSSGGVGGSKKISIRGSETNQVLVLVDGISINNQFGGSADLSTIPTNIIERVEIYEGGNSAKFGSGAIGGVINIVTKKNFSDEYKINLSTGSFGMYNIEPSISGEFKNLNFYLSYNHLYSKGDYRYTNTNTSGRKEKKTRQNSNIKRNNFYGRLNYNFDNYMLSINAQRQKSERGLPGNINALTPFARAISNNAIYGIHISASYSKVVTELEVGYYKNETENINQYSDNVPFEFQKIPRYHYSYTTDTYSMNFKTHYNPVDWYNLTVGYSRTQLDYSDQNIMFPRKGKTIAKDLSTGLYLYQKFSTDYLNKKINVSVTPILRYDNFNMNSNNADRKEEQFSPSLSAFASVWKNNRIFIKGSISKSFRVPTFSDLFYQDVRIEGKPDLLPEKSLNKEIGFGFEFNKRWELKGEFSYFNNKIDDMIIWKLGSFEIFRPFNNDAEITGESYYFKITSPKKFISVAVGYTHLNPLDKNNNETTYDKIIPYKPQHSIKTELGFSYKSILALIKYRFVSKRYVTTANTVALPYYNVFDLSIFQKVKINPIKINLNISIDNLFNEEYETVRLYPMPGREFRFGLSLIY